MSDSSSLLTFFSMAGLFFLALASGPLSRSLASFFHGSHNRRK